MVDHVAVRPALLRGAADLTDLGGDVVERHVLRLDPDLFEDLHHPLVEEGVGLLEAHPFDEGRGDDEGVGDAVAGLHEHRAAAGDAAGHHDPVLLLPLGLDLVLIRLEGADDDLRGVPLPQAHEGLATPRGDVLDERLVHRDVHHRVDDGPVDHLEVDVVPGQSVAECPADGDADRGRRDPHEDV